MQSETCNEYVVFRTLKERLISQEVILKLLEGKGIMRLLNLELSKSRGKLKIFSISNECNSCQKLFNYFFCSLEKASCLLVV